MQSPPPDVITSPGSTGSHPLPNWRIQSHSGSYNVHTLSSFAVPAPVYQPVYHNSSRSEPGGQHRSSQQRL